jgi:hypothetical protein
MDDRDSAERGDLVKDLPPLPDVCMSWTMGMVEVMRDYALAAIAPYKAEIQKMALQGLADTRQAQEALDRSEKAEAKVERLQSHGDEQALKVKLWMDSSDAYRAENAKLRELLREARKGQWTIDLLDRIDAALGEKP